MTSLTSSTTSIVEFFVDSQLIADGHLVRAYFCNKRKPNDQKFWSLVVLIKYWVLGTTGAEIIKLISSVRCARVINTGRWKRYLVQTDMNNIRCCRNQFMHTTRPCQNIRIGNSFLRSILGTYTLWGPSVKKQTHKVSFYFCRYLKRASLRLWSSDHDCIDKILISICTIAKVATMYHIFFPKYLIVHWQV